MRTEIIGTLALVVLAAGALHAAETLRQPLPYRIVSFHEGKANKALIRRAAELGYNGVQFQLEGGNVEPLKKFAQRDKTEGYVDLCHGLGMKVTLWVHELSDIPGKDDAGYLGPVELGNEKLWKHLEDRYEWVLGELLPDIDGLVLTVVETQIDATDTDLMVKLVGILRDKCEKYGKDLIVRTFVHHPDQFEGVMGCVKQLPDDTIIMSKCVPQDWQMRGIHNKAIGAVGNRQQIAEYDVAGEYFLFDAPANCFPDLVKEQYDYQMANGIDGVCVRVDRFDVDVLHAPQEVNMWALGMFASGKTDSVEEVWNAWAAQRYGEEAAPEIIKVLKPTHEVVTELLNIGSFSYGDTRRFPRQPHEDSLRTNWANFRWDESYVPEYEKGLAGDPHYVEQIESQKARAAELADQCLIDLEAVKNKLDAPDYDILRTRLANNRIQLQWRSAMMLAYLYYNRVKQTDDPAEKQRRAESIREKLAIIRQVADAEYPPTREIEHMGKRWRVDAPSWLEPDKMNKWADKMEELLTEQGL